MYLKWLNTLIRFYNGFHCTLSVSACNNLFFFTCCSSKHQELPEQVVLFLEKLLERDTISHTTLRQLDKCYNFSRGNAEVCWLYLDEGTTPWTLFKGLRVKGLIIINFLLVLSMLHWKEWSQESNNWSHLMNLIDTWTTSPRYVYRRCIRTIKNLNFDIKV